MQVQNWNYVTNLNDEYVETKFIRRLYSSVDGFPGDVTVSISYRLNNNNRLTILFEAFDVTESTVFNPTNHVYFNLSDKQDHKFPLQLQRHHQNHYLLQFEVASQLSF